MSSRTTDLTRRSSVGEGGRPSPLPNSAAAVCVDLVPLRRLVRARVPMIGVSPTLRTRIVGSARAMTTTARQVLTGNTDWTQRSPFTR